MGEAIAVTTDEELATEQKANRARVTVPQQRTADRASTTTPQGPGTNMAANEQTSVADSDDSAEMTANRVEVPVVRLSINLAPHVAEEIRLLCQRKRITVTEGARRAFALWKFLEEEQAQGHTVAIIERDESKERIREIHLWD